MYIDYKTIIRTCTACPSQWEGKLIDNRMFYARLRHGRLTIEISKMPVNSVQELFKNCILVLDMKLEDDGYISNWQFYRILLKLRYLHCGTFTKILIKYFGNILSKIEDYRRFS